jgi:hypothetical protein
MQLDFHQSLLEEIVLGFDRGRVSIEPQHERYISTGTLLGARLEEQYVVQAGYFGRSYES